MSWDKAFFDALPDGTLLASEHKGDVGHGIDRVRGVKYSMTGSHEISHARFPLPILSFRRNQWGVFLSIFLHLFPCLIPVYVPLMILHR